MHPLIKQYLDYGLSMVPLNADKIPKMKWKKFQTQLPTFIDIWQPPIALIGGQVSGGLIALDIDRKDIYEAFKKIISANRKVWSKLVIEQTKKGYHIAWRCKKVQQLDTIAWSEENKKIIEVKAEGRYFCSYPSENRTLIQGDFLHLHELTEEENDWIISVGTSFNKKPEKVRQQQKRNFWAEKGVNKWLDYYNITVFDIMCYYNIEWQQNHDWSNFWCPLPEHNEDEGSEEWLQAKAQGKTSCGFHVNGHFYCWRCGGGEFGKFIQLMEKFKTFREVSKFIPILKLRLKKR